MILLLNIDKAYPGANSGSNTWKSGDGRMAQENHSSQAHAACRSIAGISSPAGLPRSASEVIITASMDRCASMTKKVCSLLLTVAALPPLFFAQQTTGSILGVVQDPQGLVLLNAPVAARNSDTGLTRETQSNIRGEYRIDFLPPGHYELEVSSPGFRTYLQKAIILQVGQSARVDVAMQVGETSSSVTVEGGAPTVNTADATVGQTVSGQQITTLPIVNRSIYSLLTLTPGVQNTSNVIALGFPAQRTFINGGADATMGSVNYYLDGGSNVSSLRNTGNAAPNPDAVEEFRVDTNNYSAEYGRFGNGVINVITRSGTNDLHGSLFEFLRNTNLNAHTWGALQKPPLHRNQFGGSFGGPIIKNRTFFFGTYSGLRQTTTQYLSSAVVPAAALREGNFSSIAKPIIDPTTGVQFSGNFIPASRIDPTAANIIKAKLPLANASNNTYQGQVPNPYNTDEYLLKIDHMVTGSQRLSATYYTSAGNNATQPAGNLPWSVQSYDWRQQNANVDVHLDCVSRARESNLAQLHALLRRPCQPPGHVSPRL